MAQTTRAAAFAVRSVSKAGVGAWIVALTVAGCQEAPSLRLFNNSGQRLVIHLDKGLEGADRLVDELIPIQTGAAERFVASRMRDRILIVTVGGCDYRYAFPPMSWNNPWGYHDAEGNWVGIGRFPVEVQVEANLVIYLRSPAKDFAELPKRRMQPAGKLKTTQDHGFPLKPISRACPAPTSSA